MQITELLLFSLLQETPSPAGWLDTLTNGVVLATLLDTFLKITGAVLALLAGRWVIGYAVKALDSSLRTQKVDPTLIRYFAGAEYSGAGAGKRNGGR